MVQSLVAQQKRDCLRFLTIAKKLLSLPMARGFAEKVSFAIGWVQALSQVRSLTSIVRSSDQSPVLTRQIQPESVAAENEGDRLNVSDIKVQDANKPLEAAPWWIHSNMVDAYPESLGSSQAGAWTVPLLGSAANTTSEKQQALRKLEAEFETDTGTSNESPNAIAALIGCLKTETDYSVLLAAIFVAGRHRIQSAGNTLRDMALGLDVDAFDHPNAQLTSEQADRLRSEAIRMLGFLGNESAIMPLLGLLNDKNVNYRIRLVAAESLGRLGDSHALTPLLNIIQDERESSLYLKESAAKALGLLGDIRAIEPMIQMLESQKGFRGKFMFLKERLFEAIGRIGSPTPKVTDTLIRGLSDEAPSIRLAAVEALGELGDDACLEHLFAVVGDRDNDVAIASVSAIYRIGGETAIRDLLSQDNLAQFVRDELESYIP
jgi:HEAT repeat protein